MWRRCRLSSAGRKCWPRAPALDAVTEAVRLLEGVRCSTPEWARYLPANQTHELDACVMDGYSLRAGAVAGVKHLRNPVLAARLVLEKSPHVLLIGEGRKILPSPRDGARG
ncbi:isoaspartyl peptidase/L-asparaginase [Klebsiella pneumoniae]|nr:isoaspartyl peptidase/L-asparaginase [Klebsiella pneumoniae]